MSANAGFHGDPLSPFGGSEVNLSKYDVFEDQGKGGYEKFLHANMPMYVTFQTGIAHVPVVRYGYPDIRYY